MTALSRVFRTCGAFLLAVAIGHTAQAGSRDTRLIDAVRTGDVAAVRRLLAQHVDVDARAADGATALHWAAEVDDVALADMLLKAGAKPGPSNDYGVTPLTLAAGNGSTAMVERLLAAGASPDTALPTGETVLMTVAHTGRVDALGALLRHGAAVNARENVMGQSALMWSITEGHDNVTRMLLDAGADITLASNSGFTPLLFAVRAGNIEMVRLLLDKGAGVNETASDGYSALLVAILRGHVDVAKFLLDRGADPNAAGPGFTALHWVAGTWESMFSAYYIFDETAVTRVKEWAVLAGIPTQEEKNDLIRALLARGAQINARIRTVPPRFGGVGGGGFGTLVGATPFFIASVTSDITTMQLLLMHGADPAIGTVDGSTPLIVAAGLGRAEQTAKVPESRGIQAMRLLLALGANVRETNGVGNTPIHAATMSGWDKAVSYLIERGADMNARNKADETPLKLARGFENGMLLYMRPNVAEVLEKLGATE
jgi:ankyrin